MPSAAPPLAPHAPRFQVRLVDPVDRPPRGRLRGHRPEQLALVAQRRQMSQRVPPSAIITARSANTRLGACRVGNALYLSSSAWVHQEWAAQTDWSTVPGRLVRLMLTCLALHNLHVAAVIVLLIEKRRRHAQGFRNVRNYCNYSSPAALTGTLNARHRIRSAHASWRRAGMCGVVA
jgi:hypothetical protein